MKLVESVSQPVNNPPPCKYRVPSSINPVNRALVNSHFACAPLFSHPSRPPSFCNPSTGSDRPFSTQLEEPVPSSWKKIEKCGNWNFKLSIFLARTNFFKNALN